MTSQQKAKLSEYFPELKGWLSTRSTDSNSVADVMALALLQKIDMVKGDKGDKGDQGYTPVSGIDYLTPKEVKQLVSFILDKATPVKGKDYFDGESIKGDKGERGDRGDKGDSGMVYTADQIASMLNTLSGAIDSSVVRGQLTKDDIMAFVLKELKTGKNRLATTDIVNFPKKLNMSDQRWHGGGLSIVSHDATLTGNGTPSSPLSVVSSGSSGYQVPIGVVDGMNTVFTWVTAPNAIVVDGQTINAIQSDGTVNWTGTTVTTLLIAPNFNIFSVA